MATPPDFTTGAVLTAAQMRTIGMHMISSQTVSGATQFVFDNVFTTDYTNYYCTISITSATATGFMHWQERASGSNAGASYSAAGVGYYLSAGSGFQNIIASQNTAQGIVGSFDGASGSQGLIVFEIGNPRTTAYSSVTGRFSMATGNTGMYHGTVGSSHFVGTSYDGIRLFVTAGNFTGTCRIYGIRNSL